MRMPASPAYQHSAVRLPAPQHLGLGAEDVALPLILEKSLCTLVFLWFICNSKLSWLLGGAYLTIGVLAGNIICFLCLRIAYSAVKPQDPLSSMRCSREYFHCLKSTFSLLKKYISVSICLASASVRRISPGLKSQRLRVHRVSNLQNLS